MAEPRRIYAENALRVFFLWSYFDAEKVVGRTLGGRSRFRRAQLDFTEQSQNSNVEIVHWSVVAKKSPFSAAIIFSL